MKELQIYNRNTQISLTAEDVLKIKVRTNDNTLDFTTEILPIYFGSLVSLFSSNQGQPHRGGARTDNGENYIMSLFPLRAHLKSETSKQENSKDVSEKNKTTGQPPTATNTTVATTTPAALLQFEELKGDKKIKTIFNIYDMAKIRAWVCMNIVEGNVDFFSSYIVQTQKDGLYIKTGGRPMIKVSKNDCLDFARMLSLACLGVPNGYNRKSISLYYNKNQNSTSLSIGGYRTTPDMLSLHRMMLHCERFVYLDEENPVKAVADKKTKKAKSKPQKTPSKKETSAKKKTLPKSKDIPKITDQSKSKEIKTTATPDEAAASTTPP